MKKNNRKLYLLCIIFVLFIIVVISWFTLNNNNNLKSNDENTSITTWKKYILPKDDGWYYFITSDKVIVANEEGNDENTIYYTRIDGCNIKYEHLDDNYVPIIDDRNPNNNSKVLASPPNLVNSYKSKDGKKTETDELDEINALISERQWDKKITDEDLSSLKFVNFNKKDIILLWNNLYELDYSNNLGDYKNFSSCTIEKKEDSHFQVGIIFSYGYIAVVKINYIYDDGTYLTEKIESNKANSEEKEIYNNIIKIEEEIIKDGNFYLKDKFNDLKNDSFYNELFNIFIKIENGK